MTMAHPQALPTALRQRGVVLPIVLVVMMIVTTLVITQVKRGAVDERLAGNWSTGISNQAETDSMLRACEILVLNREKTAWDQKVRSENYNPPNPPIPAWQSPLQPDQYKVILPDLLPPRASQGRCIIENATEELLGSQHLGGANEQNQGRAGLGPNVRKYRFTVLLTYPDSTAFGGVTYRSQSEVRWVVRP